jgi:hypothetical protein
LGPVLEPDVLREVVVVIDNKEDRGAGAGFVVDAVARSDHFGVGEDIVANIQAAGRISVLRDINRRRDAGRSLVGRKADRVVVNFIPAAAIDHDAVAVVLGRGAGVAAARDIPDKVI